MAFLRPRSPMKASTAPRQKLWGYHGVDLAVGASAVLNFSLTAQGLAHSNDAGDRMVEAGDYEIAFSDGAQEVTRMLKVTGQTTLIETSVFRPKSQNVVV